MSGGTTRHERFQAVLAVGARRRGAIVIGTNTTGAADLTIFPHLIDKVGPMLVEIKTKLPKSGGIRVKPKQRALREQCIGGQHPVVFIVASMKVRGYRKGTREPEGKVKWEVNGVADGTAPYGAAYRDWLAGALREGYTPTIEDP